MSASAEPLVLDSATLVLPDRLVAGHVVVAGDRIVSVAHHPFTGSGERVYRLPDMFVAPGFIDLQVNGASGRDVGQGDPGGVRAIAEWCVRCGTTGFLPTVITAPVPLTRRAIASVQEAEHRTILGVHLEGPFIAPAQAGAHNPAHMLPATAGRLADIVAGHEQTLRMITMAPELPGAGALISMARDLGAVPSLGHSDATYDQAKGSLERGVKAFTHLFNAMRGFNHREPGPVAVALESDAYVQLICDGVHVHPAAVRLVAKTKGLERVCLVTDAMSAAGLGDGTYTLAGGPVFVVEGVARLGDGRLAGSTLTMSDAIRNLILYTGCTLPEAVRCATLNPARLLGLAQQKGSLEEGKDADLVIFDEQLTVHGTIVGGTMVFNPYLGTTTPEKPTDGHIIEEGRA